MRLHRAYIGLGANLGNPVAQFLAAIQFLMQLKGCSVLAVSDLYLTEPVNCLAGTPPFFNTVACVQTSSLPLPFLAHLLAYERRIGRRRTTVNAPRVLDLDLLLYEDRQVHCGRVQVPHVRLQQRAFALVPLLALAPRIRWPLSNKFLYHTLNMVSSAGQDVEWIGQFWRSRYATRV